MLVYLAGPLYNPGERYYLERLDEVCSQMGFRTYLPHRDGGLAPANGSVTRPYFESDLAGLDNCSVVLAVLNGVDVDCGTAWELGYAYAKGKRLIGIYEDTRVSDPRADFNLMLTCSMTIAASIEELRVLLGEAQFTFNARGNE